MRFPPFLAWSLLFLYALWAGALQGVLAAPAALGAFAPELGIVLLASLGPRLGPGRLELAALVVALARATLSAEPSVALVAGYVGVALFVTLLRAGLEVDRPLARAALAGGCAWMLGGLLVAVRSTALAADAPAVRVQGASLWSLALSTAAACLVLAPLFAGLPGLAQLRRRRV